MRNQVFPIIVIHTFPHTFPPLVHLFGVETLHDLFYLGPMSRSNNVALHTRDLPCGREVYQNVAEQSPPRSLILCHVLPHRPKLLN